MNDIGLKVTGTWAINSLNFYSVVGRFLEEVGELECLHLVLAKGTLEGE